MEIIKCINRKHPEMPQGRILIMRHNAMGELIMTVPLLRHIRNLFPNHAISLLSTPYAIELFKYTNNMDELIILPPNNRNRDFSSIMNDLKERNFTHFFCPMDCKVSAQVGVKLDIPVRVGFQSIADGKPFTYAIAPPENIYKPLRLLYLLQPFCKNLSELDLDLSIEKCEKDYEEANLYKTDNGPFAGLNIGGKIDIKRWPIDRFVKLGHWIKETFNYKIILFAGILEDKQMVYELANEIGNDTIVCYNLNLRIASEIIKKCKFMVTNDSGISWLTASANIPSFIIYRPGICMDAYKPKGELFTGIQARYIPDYFDTNNVEEITLEMVIKKIKDVSNLISKQ